MRKDPLNASRLPNVVTENSPKRRALSVTILFMGLMASGCGARTDLDYGSGNNRPATASSLPELARCSCDIGEMT